jgi:Periplasmic binding protein domain
VIRTGAQDAADKDNVEFKYSSSGEVPTQSTFIQNAIDSKVDGIAVSLPDPDALAPVIQKAVVAGIPVVAFNAGDRAWQKTGALAFPRQARSAGRGVRRRCERRPALAHTGRPRHRSGRHRDGCLAIRTPAGTRSRGMRT